MDAHENYTIDRANLGTGSKKQAVTKVRCDKCNDTGYYKNDIGIEVKCNCKLQTKIKREIKDTTDTKIVKGDVISAVASRLVPEERQNDLFDTSKLQDIVLNTYGKAGFKIINFQEYVDTLNDILIKIEYTKGLDRSYLIGAPNGMSKTTFANHCIKLGHSKGLKMVPYVSLVEIHDKYMQHIDITNKKLAYIYDKSDIAEYKINCVDSVKEYAWMEFVNSDILFTCLTAPECASIEQFMIRSLLNSRSRMGKPTIVFTDMPLGSYTKRDTKAAKYFWDEFIADKSCVGFGKLAYSSCFRAEK